jgi:hypothetical protein
MGAPAQSTPGDTKIKSWYDGKGLLFSNAPAQSTAS